jgi:hypothetical protein
MFMAQFRSTGETEFKTFYGPVFTRTRAQEAIDDAAPCGREYRIVETPELFNIDILPETIRHYYPAERPWVVDLGQENNWNTFATREAAEQFMAEERS